MAHDGPRNAARSAAKATVFAGSCLLGSTTVLTAPKRHFWSTPNNGHGQTAPVGPFSANRRHCTLGLK